MRKRILLSSLIVMLSTLFLQGCSTEGETSIKVVTNEAGTRIEATLKADESKNYEWKYFTEQGNLTESASEFTNDIFTETYTQKYGFVIDERVSDTLYFVLYQTDNIEAGKIFEYSVSYDNEGKIILGEKKESYLEYNQKLLEKVKAEE